MPEEDLPADVEERLLELMDDSPLNDEPLTPEQEAAVDRLMSRSIPETEEELIHEIMAGQEPVRPPSPV